MRLGATPRSADTMFGVVGDDLAVPVIAAGLMFMGLMYPSSPRSRHSRQDGEHDREPTR